MMQKGEILAPHERKKWKQSLRTSQLSWESKRERERENCAVREEKKRGSKLEEEWNWKEGEVRSKQTTVDPSEKSERKSRFK